MNIYETEKIILFIDGPNLHAAAKSLGFDIDYKKLLNLFRRQGQLIRAIYYTTLIEQQEYSSLRPLVDWLEYNGYSMVTKPAKEYVDSLGRRRIKGSMDVELTVHAMQLAEQYDHAVIFTGDGDFRRLIAALQLKGKRVSVVSTLETQPPMVADELRRQADEFIDLADLEPTISREFVERRPVVPADDADGHDDRRDQGERAPRSRPEDREYAESDDVRSSASAAAPARSGTAQAATATKPQVKVTRARARSTPPAK